MTSLRHADDAQLIVDAAAKNGHIVDLEKAHSAWDQYSDDRAAGWLGLPEDPDDLWEVVKPYLIPSPKSTHPTEGSVPEQYAEDSQLIVEAALDSGVTLTLYQAYCAWGDYSEAWAAGWMGLPDEQIDIWILAKDYVEQ
jgi:alpha-D-ribose 1-methylphosphonate 5-triphosphate synthase subunit PhnH